MQHMSGTGVLGMKVAPAESVGTVWGGSCHPCPSVLACRGGFTHLLTKNTSSWGRELLQICFYHFLLYFVCILNMLSHFVALIPHARQRKYPMVHIFAWLLDIVPSFCFQ